MKRFELFFAFLQLPLDYLALVLAGFTVYAVRFSAAVTAIRPVRFNLPWEKYWPVVLVVALGWVVIFALAGLYSTDPNRKLSRDLSRVIFACSTGFAAITVYVFFTLQKFDSRFLVLAGWLVAMAYVSLGRLFARGLKGLLYRLGVGLRRTVIIGSEAVADAIRATLIRERRLGYHIVGFYPHFSETLAPELEGLKPDELIFTNPRGSEAETLAALEFANNHHLVFKYSADLFATIATNLAVSAVAGIPLVEVRRTRLVGWGRIIKRLADCLGSIFFLILFSPFLILIAVIILIETGRPVIYKNERVGQFGQKFITLKFRTLYQRWCTGPQFGPQGEEALRLEAELIGKQSKAGPVYKIKDDPRVTPFGKFLRRWSLDELPNFWNVLKGEMSLVGPRPHQPREVEGYAKHQHIVLAIKPGITGLAQISGRSDLNFEEEVRLDAFYIENWRLLLDLIILIKTPFVVLRRRGAW